jgi:eukaryotic-like serine/threonine-protein kinase
VGEQIGHYSVLERLGGGALGDVFRARDTKVGRTVALMQTPARLVADAERRARFVEDARIAGTLNHPNIAALFDVVDQNGHCYLAYEFAAGPSLSQEMAGLRLGVRRAVELAAQIADALAEGHARGVIHGDLRPDTIVVTPRGSTKILNFGMAPWTVGGSARALAARSPGELAPEEMSVVGYLSPEQALGSGIDARSDLFTLAVMLYEMVTGRQPFVAATAPATLLNVVAATPPPASTISPDVPRELDALLIRGMSKGLDTRPQTAAALAAELRSISAALDIRSGDLRPATLIPFEADPRPVWPWGVGAMAVVGVLGWWIWR